MSKTLKPFSAWVSVFAMSFAALFFASATTSGSEKLNRSIYVPVQISLGDTFTHAVMYRGDQAIRSLPGTQVFQFTFYPRLRKLVPEAEQLHIIAYRDDGTDVDIGLVVTSCTVYIGDRTIPLDMKKMLERLRHRVDYRYEPVRLKLGGGEAPSRTVADDSKGP